MSGRYVDIDMSEFKEFFGSLERAARGDFRKEFELFLAGPQAPLITSSSASEIAVKPFLQFGLQKLRVNPVEYVECAFPGNEFLRILQDEIVRRKVLDSRQLLASFEKGGDGNVWNIESAPGLPNSTGPVFLPGQSHIS